MKVKNLWVKINCHLKYTFKPLPLVIQILKFSIRKDSWSNEYFDNVIKAKNARNI